MLKWVFERVDGAADAVETPIGLLPAARCARHRGLDVSDDDLDDAAVASTSTAGRKRSRRSASTTPASATTIPAALQLAVDTLEHNLDPD